MADHFHGVRNGNAIGTKSRLVRCGGVDGATCDVTWRASDSDHAVEVAVAGGGVWLLRGWSVRGNASQSTLVTDLFERIGRLDMELDRLKKLSRVGRKAVVILVILYMIR